MVTSTEGVQKSTRLDASAKAAEARLLEARVVEERERLERLQARQIEVSIRDEKALEEHRRQKVLQATYNAKGEIS